MGHLVDSNDIKIHISLSYSLSKSMQILQKLGYMQILYAKTMWFAHRGIKVIDMVFLYSFFNSTAGLVFAAFNVCHSTVPKAMASEMMTATTKTKP